MTESLIAQLNDREWTVRERACKKLAAAPDGRALEPLLLLLADPRWEVCQAALEPLEALGEGGPAHAMLAALEGAPEQLACLAAGGDLRPVEPLLLLADDDRWAVNEAARRALRSIVEVIAPRLNELLCSSCLAGLEERDRQSRDWKPVFWIACRICGKARRVLTGVVEAVAVLDKDWEEERASQEGVVRVNWLKRQALFDFDRVEIRRATDYEVERFAIAVGNDTDPQRSSRYHWMPCRVARACALSENTLRILRATFGEVSVQPAGSANR